MMSRHLLLTAAAVLLISCAAKREIREGESALSAGKSSSAERHFQAALEARPGHARALYGLARAAMQDGRPEAAITPARTAWEQGVAEAGTVLASALVAVGRGVEAGAVLEALDPDDPSLVLLRAEAALASGDRAAAYHMLAPRLEDSRDPRLLALAAWLCARVEDARCAVSLAGRASSLGQDDADVMAEVAAVMRAAGARDEAAAAATRARSVLRAQPRDFAIAGERRALAHDMEGSLRYFAQARALDPSEGRFALLLGRAYLDVEDWPRAAAELSAALGMAPYKDPTRAGAIIVATPGDLSEPDRKAVRAALLHQLSTARRQQGDPAGSAAALEEALALDPSAPVEAWLDCAALWSRAGKRDRAISVLLAADQRLGLEAAAGLAIAAALREAGEITRALVIARRVWERDPRNVEAGLLVGALHEARGEHRAAWEVYQLSSRLLPGETRLTEAARRVSGYISP